MYHNARTTTHTSHTTPYAPHTTHTTDHHQTKAIEERAMQELQRVKIDEHERFVPTPWKSQSPSQLFNLAPPLKRSDTNGELAFAFAFAFAFEFPFAFAFAFAY
jgi:hypothetical protein